MVTYGDNGDTSADQGPDQEKKEKIVPCKNCGCPFLWETQFGRFECRQCLPPPTSSMVKTKIKLLVSSTGRVFAEPGWAPGDSPLEVPAPPAELADDNWFADQSGTQPNRADFPDDNAYYHAMSLWLIERLNYLRVVNKWPNPNFERKRHGNSKTRPSGNSASP